MAAHILAGSFIPFDHYTIVAALFNDETYPPLRPKQSQKGISKLFSKTSQRSLKEALDILSKKGLTPAQIETVKTALSNALSKTVSKSTESAAKRQDSNEFHRIDFNENYFLGIKINGKEIDQNLSQRAKLAFIDNLCDALGWKHTDYTPETSYSMETQWPADPS